MTDDDYKEIASEMETLFGASIAHSVHEPLKFAFQIKLAQRAIARRKAEEAQVLSTPAEPEGTPDPVSGDSGQGVPDAQSPGSDSNEGLEKPAPIES